MRLFYHKTLCSYITLCIKLNQTRPTFCDHSLFGSIKVCLAKKPSPPLSVQPSSYELRDQNKMKNKREMVRYLGKQLCILVCHRQTFLTLFPSVCWKVGMCVCVCVCSCARMCVSLVEKQEELLIRVAGRAERPFIFIADWITFCHTDVQYWDREQE